MAGSLVDQIVCAADRAGSLYERLVLVVGSAGTGKTAALLDVARRTGYSYVNLNLTLSQRLLEVPVASRPFRAPDLLDDLVEEIDGSVLLDNLELLFNPELELQPLNWLRRTSRNRTIVATWNGVVEQGHLTYAVQGHPEYCRETVGDVVIVRAGSE